MTNTVFSIRTLTISAMLVAIGVVLSFLRIPLSTITEVTLTGLPIAVGGYLFGPVIGFIEDGDFLRVSVKTIYP